MKTISEYGEDHKLHFALKTAGLHPAGLPEEVITNVRAEISGLVWEDGFGRLYLEPNLIGTILERVRTEYGKAVEADPQRVTSGA